MTALAGRVALVTGASHGTGVDVAIALAGAGARVAVHYDFVTGQAIVMDGGRTIPRFPKLNVTQD